MLLRKAIAIAHGSSLADQRRNVDADGRGRRVDLERNGGDDADHSAARQSDREPIVTAVRRRERDDARGGRAQHTTSIGAKAELKKFLGADVAPRTDRPAHDASSSTALMISECEMFTTRWPFGSVTWSNNSLRSAG